jgi:SAM-dependent methyltransferase
MSYEDITIRDRNPAKRWIHDRRFAHALLPLRKTRASGPITVLDFGGADGELIRRLAGGPAISACLYEPEASAMAQARRKLSGLDWVAFAGSLDGLAPGSFDYVFCLEVLEHLPERETGDALASIHRLLKQDGRAVIGVPHELHVPALLKGLFRMSRRYGAFDARVGNVAAAAVGAPPHDRPPREVAPGLFYYDSHLGFDFRALEQKFTAHALEITDKWFSPLPFLGSLLNSEVYYLLRKTASGQGAAVPAPAV